MIDKNTVFILGAGASHPYGYPTGQDLRTYICDNFTENFKRISEQTPILGKKSHFESKADLFSKTFKLSSTPSIDLFLSRNQHFSDIGRLAIISSLFHFEHNSKFHEDINEKDQDWYSYLYQRMTSNLIKQDDYKNFGNNKVTFITFNYDRSLEHFLFESLKNSFSETHENEITSQLKKIPIYHIYGKIKALPWEDKSNGTPYRTKNDRSPYDEFSLDHFLDWMPNIRIVHDGPPSNLSNILAKIAKAEKVFYLGFGYAPENLESLQLPRFESIVQEVYGTALNFTPLEILRTRNRIVDNLRNDAFPARLKNIGCLELLREHL